MQQQAAATTKSLNALLGLRFIEVFSLLFFSRWRTKYTSKVTCSKQNSGIDTSNSEKVENTFTVWFINPSAEPNISFIIQPVENIMWSIPPKFLAETYTTYFTQGTTSSILQDVTENLSVPQGCHVVRFEEMEFLPWDNPDNIVSAEVEDITRRLKNAALPVLFLIGGPANVINMAVFYKQGLKERVSLCLFALSLADVLYLIQMLFFYGEQLHVQFTTKESFGPVMRFMVNNNLVGFFGFSFVSQILSAIIASERCLCVLSPLRSQTLLQTRTMAAIIVVVYLVVVGFYFVMALRYRIECVFDPASDTALFTSRVLRKKRTSHQLPRQLCVRRWHTWVRCRRGDGNDDNNSDEDSPGSSVASRDLFSKRPLVVVVIADIFPGAGPDQNVDRHRSAVHRVYFSPRFLPLCLALSAGDECWTSLQ